MSGGKKDYFYLVTPPVAAMDNYPQWVKARRRNANYFYFVSLQNSDCIKY
jgi:hypothetical protein